ncbi:ABC transporter ATP-binding protein YtrE [Lysinibacillus alkalisoli]|uniref:ABC transporter ATP-binding protein YtrE n=1 Tax=Lysinibacillus alkalisoli TaxID=1911548 RepID=A0A917G580_9BACI|nr:ABC transporter ATP-binding protein [Lysinibacillus alkalisoli]GGG22910.1 ABC transporter ATP-binding protein YtrE [Lysinibacillus alkalisoli]
MIEIKHVSHTFKIGKKDNEQEIPVLTDVALHVHKGEVVAIVGKSGSGKSTLLQTIAGFLHADVGSIQINGQETMHFTEEQHAAFRLDNFGFVFQNFQLMPGLTAFENIELPLILQGVPSNERKQRVQKLMEQIGLTEVAKHYPNELSGGQQQRVSIGRSLITNPPIILADEPTGSLDSETEQEILALIKDLNEALGITFIIITHDDEVANVAHRRFRMHDGILKEEA